MAASSTGLLVLLRHGQSTSNAAGEFTGWLDSPLTAFGRRQAADAGRRMAAAGITPDAVHTPVLARAIVSADLALAELERCWIPVRRSWRLNERHYGALTGRGKDVVRAEVGEQRYRAWRNSLRIAPPPMPVELLDTLRRDPRYVALPAELVPATESLGDVVDRLLPYWSDVLVPQLRGGLTVLVVAHGNSLRALASHLDQRRLQRLDQPDHRRRPGRRREREQENKINRKNVLNIVATWFWSPVLGIASAALASVILRAIFGE